MKGKLFDLLYAQESGGINKLEEADKLLFYFNKVINEFESDLQLVFGKSVIRMTQTSSSNDELLNFACSCVHGAYQEVNIPKVGMYIDILVGSQDFVGGNEPKIGNKFIKTIAIEGFPMESYPATLDGLSHIPIEYRWNSRFIYLDKEEAESLIDKQRRKWKQKVRGFKDQLMNTTTGAINFDAQNMAEDAEMAMSESSSGVVRFGYYNSVIILMHQSKELLEEAVELTVKSIKNLGFVPRVKTINAIESYLGSLLGHGYYNVRRFIIVDTEKRHEVLKILA